MITRFFIALLLAVLVYSPVNAESTLTEAQEELLHKAFIEFSDLRDPFNVQLRKIRLYNQTEPATNKGSGFQICGELNTKTIYGGYTGWYKFVATITTKDKGAELVDAYIVTESVNWPDVVSKYWNDSPCAAGGERTRIEELEDEASHLYELFSQEDIDAPDDPDIQPAIRHRAYYDHIWSQIRSSWVLPDGVKTTENLLTVVAIKVGAEGAIEAYWIEKRSGNEYFDQSTIRAIRKASPLPPIPEELGAEPLEIGVNFRYPE